MSIKFRNSNQEWIWHSLGLLSRGFGFGPMIYSLLRGPGHTPFSTCYPFLGRALDMSSAVSNLYCKKILTKYHLSRKEPKRLLNMSSVYTVLYSISPINNLFNNIDVEKMFLLTSYTYYSIIWLYQSLRLSFRRH